MKMPPDDAYALRMALENLTHPAVEGGDSVFVASIAISLKRIADAMDRNGSPEAIVAPAPTITFAGDGTGDMIVSHPAWDHAFKVMRGVVLIDGRQMASAFVHGWQSMSRATTPQETELGLIRVFKI